MKRMIDHIVYCVLDLEAAVEDLHRRLGIRPAIGGRHMSKGTKNALINVGGGCYLEILAADETNEFHSGARWMGVDLIKEPKVTRWSLKTEQINEDAARLGAYSPDLAHVIRGRRETQEGAQLEWVMTVPLPSPEVELAPFFTDWSGSEVHPTDSLEEVCKLVSIEFVHPDPDSVRDLLEGYNPNIDLKKGEKSAICIYVDSPKGIIKL